MVDYKEYLFYDAPPEIHKRTRELRKKMTEAEKRLWEKLRNRNLGELKFHRQHPISTFIADFYCHEKKLVAELDGEIHFHPENREYDEGRTAELEDMGIHVIRFKNEEVLQSMPRVLKQLLDYCNFH